MGICKKNTLAALPAYPAPPMENKLYFKKLDSLRFFAFFLVFWQHTFAHSLSSITGNDAVNKIIRNLCLTGGLGGHIFFVTCGFL